jgi:hypothetical protein
MYNNYKNDLAICFGYELSIELKSSRHFFWIYWSKYSWRRWLSSKQKHNVETWWDTHKESIQLLIQRFFQRWFFNNCPNSCLQPVQVKEYQLYTVQTSIINRFSIWLIWKTVHSRRVHEIKIESVAENRWVWKF